VGKREGWCKKKAGHLKNLQKMNQRKKWKNPFRKRKGNLKREKKKGKNFPRKKKTNIKSSRGENHSPQKEERERSCRKGRWNMRRGRGDGKEKGRNKNRA